MFPWSQVLFICTQFFFHICTLAASRVCHLEFNAEHQVQVSLVDVVFSSLGSFLVVK